MLIKKTSISIIYTTLLFFIINILPVYSKHLEITDQYKGIKNKFIYIIEDLHCNESMQYKIYEIIKHLKSIHKNNLKMIGVEGASGYIDTSILKNIKNSKYKDVFLNHLLRNAYITGSDLYILNEIGKLHNNGYSTKFFGTENMSLYKQNFKALYNIFAIEPEVKTLQTEINDILTRAKQISYPAKLLKFERFQIKYEAEKITFSKYINTIWNYLVKYNKDALYPTIKQYTHLTKTNKKIDKFKLMHELRDAEYTIKKGLSNNWQDALDLIETERNTKAFFKAITASSSRENLQSWQKTKDMFYVRIENMMKKYIRMNHELKKIIKSLRNFENFATSFYSFAKKRDEVLINNLIKNTDPDTISIMVTGGFHVKGMTKILRARGISYKVLRPQISCFKCSKELYKKRLKEQAEFFLKDNSFIGNISEVPNPSMIALLDEFYLFQKGVPNNWNSGFVEEIKKTMLSSNIQQQVIDQVFLSIIKAIPETEDVIIDHRLSVTREDILKNMSSGYALHRIICDKNGKPIDYVFLETNKNFHKLTGIPKSVLYKSVRTALPGIENSKPDFIKIYGNVSITGKPINFIAYSDHLKKWYHISAYCPKINYFVAIFEDITDKRKLEILIKKSEEKYRSYIENSNIGVFVVNAQGNYIEVNDYACKMTGFSREELLKMSIKDLAAKGERPFGKLKKLQSKGSLDITLKLRRKNKTPFPSSLSAVVLGDGNLIAFCRDLTEEFKAISAKEKEKSMRDLLAIVTHDLAGPINGIIHYIEALTGTDLTEEQKSYMKIIINCSESVQSLLSRLLIFFKLRADKVELDAESFNVKEYLSKLIDTMKIKAMRNDTVLKLNIEKKVPHYIVADKVRFDQIMSNLISNAIKFTEKGKVEVNVALESKKLRSCRIYFEVKDTGVGIEKENMQKIFRKFEQESSKISTKFQGTGLGLSIAKNLVELMGGDLEVESEGKERGAKFYFLLNFKIGSKPIKEVKPKEMKKEDKEESKVQNKEEISITVVPPVTEWFILAKQFYNYLYGKVFGQEQEKTKKKKKSKKKKKFVKQLKRVKKIKKVIKHKTKEELKILIVDDMSMFHLILRGNLMKLGYKNIEVASDGDEAVEKYKSEQYDIIFMDNIMKRKHGLAASKEVLEFAKQDKTIQVLPFIIMTTGDIKKKTKYTAKALGISFFVNKPFYPKQIEESLKFYNSQRDNLRKKSFIELIPVKSIRIKGEEKISCSIKTLKNTIVSQISCLNVDKVRFITKPHIDWRGDTFYIWKKIIKNETVLFIHEDYVIFLAFLSKLYPFEDFNIIRHTLLTNQLDLSPYVRIIKRLARVYYLGTTEDVEKVFNYLDILEVGVKSFMQLTFIKTEVPTSQVILQKVFGNITALLYQNDLVEDTYKYSKNFQGLYFKQYEDMLNGVRELYKDKNATHEQIRILEDDSKMIVWSIYRDREELDRRVIGFYEDGVINIGFWMKFKFKLNELFTATQKMTGISRGFFFKFLTYTLMRISPTEPPFNIEAVTNVLSAM